MLPEIATDEFAEALDSCVEGVLWEAGVDAPPVDALSVAKRLGMVVAHDVGYPGRARFARLADPRRLSAGQTTIVVGPAERPEREQWAVAHEIGESVAYRVFDRLRVKADAAPETAREQVANHLATCLLLPRSWFNEHGSAVDWDVIELKRRFSTASHELIARRMLQMTPPIVITLYDQGALHWRRSNVSGRPPRVLPQETAAWRETHVTGMPTSVPMDPVDTGLMSVRAWAIHEPHWKREIARSEIAEAL